MDYAWHYDALIARARLRVFDGYVERHHIVPRCLGGSNDPDNLVDLTPEEHFVAHQLLVKIHPGKGKLVFAALAMTRGRPGNKRYGWLRRHFSKQMSAVWLGKTRPPFTDEHRKKISDGQLGRVRGPHSDEHKARLSAAHTGKTLTKEHKEKLGAAKRGKKQSAEHIAKKSAAQAGKQRVFTEEHMANVVASAKRVATCPHCAKTGVGSGMFRWHFDNCKVAA